MNHVFKTVEDIICEADEGIVGIFPDVECGQHGNVTEIVELGMVTDWKNGMIYLHVVDVCVFCGKPAGDVYMLSAIITEEV